jgi:hypothetical protein
MKIDKTNFLEQINDVLEHHIDYVGDGRSYPNYFIVGVPRSGTTILAQILAYVTNVGFINNLAAIFWGSPEVGALLAEKLLRDRQFLGNSRYGQTDEISEPHEFGAFWRKYLDYPDTAQIDSHTVYWAPLLQKLDNVSNIFGSPVLYKVFQLMWHLAEFHAMRPDTRWVWIRRDETENVESLMGHRRNLDVGDADWASVVPLRSRQFDSAPPLVKCASQVIFIDEWIEGQLRQVPGNSQIEVNLDSMQVDPEKEITRVCDFLDLDPDRARLDHIKPKLSRKKQIAEMDEIRKALDHVRSYRDR